MEENHLDVGNYSLECNLKYSVKHLVYLVNFLCSSLPTGEKILFVFCWDHFDLFLNNRVYKTNSSFCNKLLSSWNGTFVVNAGFKFKCWIFQVFIFLPSDSSRKLHTICLMWSNWIKVPTKRCFNIFIHTAGDFFLSVFSRVLSCGCTRVYLFA